MKLFTEKKAEEFLEKEGFEIVGGVYVGEEDDLREAVEKIGFPLVMKVSGKEIVHKSVLGGVELDINSYEKVLEVFEKLKKIDGFEEVFLQRQLKGEWFLLGIKKTPEFGQVVAFGAGGVETEKLKDVSFRVVPFEREDAEEMISETEIGNNITDKKILVDNLVKLSDLCEKFPTIKELDINPLMNGIVVDARIVFE